jgi:hypothetical protein
MKGPDGLLWQIEEEEDDYDDDDAEKKSLLQF